MCVRERQMTVVVYVIPAGGVMGRSLSAGSFGTLEYGQFFIDQCTEDPEAADKRFRHMAGVVRQMRCSTSATESSIRVIVTHCMPIDDFADVCDQIRHALSCPRS